MMMFCALLLFLALLISSLPQALHSKTLEMQQSINQMSNRESDKLLHYSFSLTFLSKETTSVHSIASSMKIICGFQWYNTNTIMWTIPYDLESKFNQTVAVETESDSK